MNEAQEETIEAGVCPHCLSRELSFYEDKIKAVSCNQCLHIYILNEESPQND
jgi:hypothetical protein